MEMVRVRLKLTPTTIAIQARRLRRAIPDASSRKTTPVNWLMMGSGMGNGTNQVRRNSVTRPIAGTDSRSR